MTLTNGDTASLTRGVFIIALCTPHCGVGGVCGINVTVGQVMCSCRPGFHGAGCDIGILSFFFVVSLFTFECSPPHPPPPLQTLRVSTSFDHMHMLICAIQILIIIITFSCFFPSGRAPRQDRLSTYSVVFLSFYTVILSSNQG